VKINSIVSQIIISALMVVAIEGCLHHSDSSADTSSDAKFAELHTQIVDAHKAAAQTLGYHPRSYAVGGLPSREAAAVVSDCATAGSIVSTFTDSGGMTPGGWVLVTCHGFTYPLDADGNVTGLLATVRDGSPILGFSLPNCQGTQYVTQGPGLSTSTLQSGIGYRYNGEWKMAGGPGQSTSHVDFASSVGFDTQGHAMSCQNASLTGLDAYTAQDNDQTTGITSGQIDPVFGSP